jgi:hypothetical protein
LQNKIHCNYCNNLIDAGFKELFYGGKLCYRGNDRALFILTNMLSKFTNANLKSSIFDHDYKLYWINSETKINFKDQDKICDECISELIITDQIKKDDNVQF